MQVDLEEARKEQLWPLVKTWYESDEEGKEAIVAKWLSRDDEANWLIWAALDYKYLPLVCHLCRGDLPIATDVLDKTYEEFSELFCKGKLIYQGERTFLSLFTERLSRRCQDQFRIKKRPLCHEMIPAESSFSETYGGLPEEEQETSIGDTIPADTPFTEVYGGWTSPEEFVIEHEERQEAAIRCTQFIERLPSAIQETLKVRLTAYEEANGDIRQRELNRITKEIMGIGDQTLYTRLFRIRLLYNNGSRDVEETASRKLRSSR
jgi:hypothetical protein